MKPYQHIPITECGEPMIALPVQFSRQTPHAYQQLGAPYGAASPFMLRSSVVARLAQAQFFLQRRYPEWRMRIFDGYRPVAVQQFMVQWTFDQQLQAQGWQLATLTSAQREQLYSQVYQFWAVPSLEPATPPPHSTGGALDVTLEDSLGRELDLGSPIDEVSERSYPDYFVTQDLALHHRRTILNQAMHQAGFARHPQEWWHFSYGDQLWAWQIGAAQAIYGRVPTLDVAH